MTRGGSREEEFMEIEKKKEKEFVGVGVTLAIQVLEALAEQNSAYKKVYDSAINDIREMEGKFYGFVDQVIADAKENQKPEAKPQGE